MKYRNIVGTVALSIISLCVWASPPPNPPKDFTKAKQIARNQIYAGNLVDFYCSCQYKPTDTLSGGKLIPESCGYKVKSNHTTGTRLEWEHVVPAAFFGRELACWKDGNERCVKNGVPFSGRKCCQLVDQNYDHTEGDLHNLVPSVGELNNNRSDLPYGTIEGEDRLYGSCDFEIGGNPKVTEPPDDVRGDAARVWLYMIDTYGVKVSAEEMTRFKAWMELDPVSDWERLRDARIKALQGNSNKHVSEAEADRIFIDLRSH